jgi:hypothetical protein
LLTKHFARVEAWTLFFLRHFFSIPMTPPCGPKGPAQRHPPLALRCVHQPAIVQLL